MFGDKPEHDCQGYHVDGSNGNPCQFIVMDQRKALGQLAHDLPAAGMPQGDGVQDRSRSKRCDKTVDIREGNENAVK